MALRKVLCALLLTAQASSTEAGQVELVSRAAPGSSQTGGPVYADLDSGSGFLFAPPSFSADGRYVAFGSSAANLVPGQVDVNSRQVGYPYQGWDVFLHDQVAGTTVLVSHSFHSSTRTGNALSIQPVLSADGRYVLFNSYATDLIPGQVDSAETFDTFLYDRVTGALTLVSRAAGTSTQAAGGSDGIPAVSADGEYIAFGSRAMGLVSGANDPNNEIDVFLFERSTGAMTLVSHAAGQPGSAANHESRSVQISSDGRYLAFYSKAGNLVAGQVQPVWAQGNVFLYDRVTGTTALVSHTVSSAVTGVGGLDTHALSADGRFVAFSSTGSNLIAGQADVNGNSPDAFLYDRLDGAVTLMSHSAASPTQTGDLGSVGSGPFAISADGSYVAFESNARDLVPGQLEPEGPGSVDVFLFQRLDGSLALVSHAADSAITATWSSHLPKISADGRYVVFESSAPNLVPGQTPHASHIEKQIFRYDRVTGDNSLLSGAGGSATQAANSYSHSSAFSANGRYVAFYSRASNLASGTNDLNLGHDVFLSDLEADSTSILTVHAPGMASASPNYVSGFASISGDGRYVVFLSGATNLVPGQPALAGADNVYLYDRVTGGTTLVSHVSGSPLTASEADSEAASISRDGNWIVFISWAPNLVPGQIGPTFAKVFLYDRVSGTTVLVSHVPGAATTGGDGYSYSPRISADGRYVVFLSDATNLVSGQIDTSYTLDAFLYDRTTGEVTLISRTSSSATTASGVSGLDVPAISADGSSVAFTGFANVIPGQGTTEGSNVFLFETASGAITLVSRHLGSPTDPAERDSFASAVSADGRYVAFTSGARDLVPGFVGLTDVNVFLFDRIAGTTQLVSRSQGSSTTSGNGTSSIPGISDDGRYVVFGSSATNLVPGQVDGSFPRDVFVFDRVAGDVSLVTHASNSSETAVGGEQQYTLSADGRYVAFASKATNLTPGQIDSPDSPDVFLWDRISRTTELVSRSLALSVATGDNHSIAPALSADGHQVAFSSGASNLVAHDFNIFPDVFLYQVEPPPGRSFFTLPPCRLLDTRQPGDGPALTSGVPASLSLHGACGIPSTAVAVVVNVTVVQPTGAGHLTFHPGDVPAPLTSMINFRAGQTRANYGVFPLALSGDGTLAVTPHVSGNGTVHLILDTAGYFE